MYKKTASFVLIISVIALNFGFLIPREAMATSLTNLSDTITNLTTGALANHTIIFTAPSGVPIGGVITLTFNNSTSIPSGLNYADMDLEDNGAQMTLSNVPGTAIWGASVNTGTKTITFTNGTVAIPSGDTITILIGTNATYGATGVNQITNGSLGTTTLSIAGSSGFNDTGVMSMAIVSNDVVSVSAQVLSTLSFNVSSNAIYFGILKSSGSSCWALSGGDPGNVTCPQTTEAEAFNMTAATNGTSGYTVTVQGPTLTSGTNTIAPLTTATAPIVGTEQFGIRINSSGGTGTVPALYGTPGEYAYTATATTPATVASAPSSTLTTTYSVRYMANISPATKAGSYTANHTYVITGNF
jgi:hypothetical protein